LAVERELINMNRLVLAGAVLAVFTAPAFAAPTALQESAPSATGTDPVLLNDATEFRVIDNSGAATNMPLRLFFAEPIGDPPPSITSAMFDDATTDTFTSPSLVGTGTWNMRVGPAKDLYTFVGCTSCNNSVNVSNIETALKGVGLGSVTSLSVYEVDVNPFFTAKNQFIDVKGTFQLGTVILPLGDDQTTKKGVTTNNFLDTSWTNAAFVNVPPSVTLTAIPEPSTWAMMGVGFALLGLAGYRRSVTPMAIA
jgi:hypothetical protein